MTGRRLQGTDNAVKARLNLVLTGEAARVLLDLKRRLGLSNRAIITQALIALSDKIVARDLKLKALAEDA